MFIVVDNYDSFTYNLVHYLGELGAKIEVHRNDQITVDEILAREPEGIVVSPGPCTPNEAGISLELVQQAGAVVPILGVCLGHQSIGQAYGGKVVRAPTLMHGKLSDVLHTNASVFTEIANPFRATRYHSLIVERETLPKALMITAETEDGIVMGLCHRQYPVHGVQFHPESIASEYGHKLLENFIAIAHRWNSRRRVEAALP